MYSEKGMLLMRRRDYNRAYPELKRAYEADPSNAQNLNALGLCTVSLGFMVEGVQRYQEAVALKPTMRDSWMNMGAASSCKCMSGQYFVHNLGLEP